MQVRLLYVLVFAFSLLVFGPTAYYQGVSIRLVTPAYADEVDRARDLVQTKAKHALETYTKKGSSKKFVKFFERNADFERICLFMMGPLWKQMSKAQQKKFKDFEKKRIEKIHEANFEKYKGGILTVLKSVKKGRRVTVNSVLKVPEKPGVNVSWVVQNGKFVNLKIEEISVFNTHRSEYRSITGGRVDKVDYLLDQMEQKIS